MKMTSKKYNIDTDFTVDNRRYFRIDDEVTLTIKPIDRSQKYENLQSYYDEKVVRYQVSNRIDYEDDKFMPLSNVIKNKYPEVHEYIKHLENKINIISKRYENENEIDGDNAHLQKVNISASGMNFITSKKYEKSEFVEVYITLYPDDKKIYLIAKILRVNILSIDRLSTSMEFLIINDANKEILIKHIHAKQLKDLHK